eukprot:TRINITY_DN35634_c0_g3_i1.p1 TRINITY_DN35634_c0_g3~~TRINITY_DN35634_c0_g3_i1.p1  ORF type:complete len:548 (+),score=204.21 TRINITY_DN35634_c0_g3_i1:106-1644(+)
MSIAVCAAADVAGDKHNFELLFPGVPSLPELEAAVASAYVKHFGASRFSLGKLQLYDLQTNSWADLHSPAQLHDGCQVYCFNNFADEVQQAIPPARRVATLGGSAAGLPPRPDASHEDKVKAVFAEVDVNGNRLIEVDEWRRAFAMLRFDFSAEVVSDLFRRGDCDHDGAISPHEWERFCEIYPTLLDSMYFRSRDYWEDFRHKQEVRAAEDELASRKDGETDAHQRHLAAQQATEEHGRLRAAAKQRLADLQEQERAAAARLADAQAALDAAAQGRQDALRALDADRAEVDRAREVQERAQLEADRAEQQARQCDMARTQAADYERRAKGMVEETQQALERARQNMRAAETGLMMAQQRSQDSKRAAQEKADASDQLAQDLARAETDLREKQFAEREQDELVLGAQQRLRHAEQLRDDEVRVVQGMEQREAQAAAAHADAQRNVAEAEGRARLLEEQRVLAAARRRQIEEQERPLLEQEIRLRDQRDQLQEREARLRHDASSFRGVRAGSM